MDVLGRGAIPRHVRLEPYVDAALATLRATLPGLVAAINADVSDGVEVPAPAGYYYGVQHEIWAYPAVEVAAPDADLGSLSLGQHEGDLTVTVLAMVWHQHTDPVVLWRSLDRLSSCVLDALTSPGAFGAGAIVDAVSVRTRVNPETRESPQVTAGVLHAYTVRDVTGPR